jgi:signal transduction histidine kinase
MGTLGSLSNRLFLVCVVLTTASIGAAMLFVSARLTREHDRALATRLDETITLVERQRRLGLEASTRLARLVADLPKLKAALATSDAATVAPIVSSYRDEIGADVLIVSEADGVPLFTAGDVRGDVASHRMAPPSAPSSAAPVYTTLAHPRGVLQLVSVPIVIGFDPVERLGMLSVGMLLDDAQARQLRASTGSELAFAMGPRALASSLGGAALPALSRALQVGDSGRLDVGAVHYAWHRYALQPMAPAVRAATEQPPGAGGDVPQLIVLHSTAEAEGTLRSVRIALAVIALLTALVASLASYGVARSITRPLAGLTASMREMTRTGDLSRRPHHTASHAWDDEDVRVLAGTFDTLTEAIDRFQQQAAQRDRLTALGRLSTVIAHEIRNPLMIVRGALRGLRRQDDPAVADAAVDIEEQVQRLDRVVNDVLDFARPLQLDVVPASLHAVCRDAVSACVAAEPLPPVGLDLDDAADAVRTDPDRLRTALVNLIANAREAVRAADGPLPASPAVIVRTRRVDRGVSIDVIDHGGGIAASVAGQVFEPYVTTRRTGTGLGLAIARNIVDGLGGTITLDGAAGGPTVARITLPQEKVTA